VERQSQRSRRIRRQRQRAIAIAALAVLLVGGIAFASCSGGPSTSSATTTSPAPAQATSDHKASTAGGPASIEAGVEPWQLGAPLSRESVVANGTGLSVLGGITPSGTSLATVSTISPAGGAVATATALATPVHDAAAVALGRTTYVVGGGSPDTVATVQSLPTPAIPPATASTVTSAATVVMRFVRVAPSDRRNA
jgi:hypothetical protein